MLLPFLLLLHFFNQVKYNLSVSQAMYRELSPIRSHSPGPKPKIIFNYQPSPIRQRHIESNHRITNLTNHQPRSFVQNIHQKALTPTKHPQPYKPPYQSNKTLPYPQQRHSYFMNQNMNINIHNATQFHPTQKANVKMMQIERKQPRQSKKFQTNVQQNILKQRQINALNRIPSSKVIESHTSMKSDQKAKEYQLQSFLFKIAQGENSLRSLLSHMNEESFNHQIKVYYKELKLKLKKHYENIKQSIKISIERDLLELDSQEKQLIKYIQLSRVHIQDNVKEINIIFNDIEPYKAEILTMIDEEPFKDMLLKHKEHFGKIEEQKMKLEKVIGEIFRDSGENNVLSSVFESFKKEKSLVERNVLYSPEHYIMFDEKGKKQVCFSFDNEKND